MHVRAPDGLEGALWLAGTATAARRALTMRAQAWGPTARSRARAGSGRPQPAQGTCGSSSGRRGACLGIPTAGSSRWRTDRCRGTAGAQEWRPPSARPPDRGLDAGFRRPRSGRENLGNAWGEAAAADAVDSPMVFLRPGKRWKTDLTPRSPFRSPQGNLRQICCAAAVLLRCWGFPRHLLRRFCSGFPGQSMDGTAEDPGESRSQDRRSVDPPVALWPAL